MEHRRHTLYEITSQLHELIQELETIQFEIGDLPLSITEEGSRSGEIYVDINQLLREGEEEWELFVEEVEDLPSGRAGSELHLRRRELTQQAELMKRDLKSCQYSFRNALLSASRNLRIAHAEERKAILQSYLPPPQEHNQTQDTEPSKPTQSIDLRGGKNLAEDRKNLFTLSCGATPLRRSSRRQHGKPGHPFTAEQQTLGASSDVTSALRRTHALIATELSRSEFAHTTLQESSEALSQLHESYSRMDTILMASRNLVTTLVNSQKSDTWYLLTSLYVLLATAAWLVFRRWLYGPLWWLIWLPLRLLLGGVGWSISKSGSTDSISSISSVVSSTLMVPTEMSSSSTASFLQPSSDYHLPDEETVLVEEAAEKASEALNVAQSMIADVMEDEPPSEQTHINSGHLVKDEL